jgi:mannitol-1-phosphate/altronate dehydrogenase
MKRASGAANADEAARPMKLKRAPGIVVMSLVMRNKRGNRTMCVLIMCESAARAGVLAFDEID